MSRLFAVLPLALLLVMARAADAAPPQDFVTGGGHHSVPDTQFTISAHSGPAGEDARGQLSFKIEGQPRIKAEVSCLVVTGNTAIATATYTDEDGAEQVVVMEAVDNGEPSGETPDLLRFSFAGAIVPDPANADCFLPVLAPVPVTQGNIVVKDAPAA
jgi:hypothetical protein